MDTLALVRIKGRFRRLFETFIDEYWKTHQTFSIHGCSLLPADISGRSFKVASFLATLLMIVTLPVIYYYRGLSDLEPYYGLGVVFFASWLMFYALVWVAHVLWATSYIIGSKFGGSRYFWGIIEKRWGARIDKITKELMQNPQEFLETPPPPEELEEEEEDEDDEIDGNNN